MNFQFMKKVDYLLGIPVCFILTLVSKMLGIFSTKKATSKKPRKILLIKPSEMGAIVLSYPLMQRLKKEYPSATLYFLTFESNKGLFDVLGCPTKKNIWTIRDRSMLVFIKDVLSVIVRMRKEKFDVIIDLEFFSRFTAMMSYLSGTRRRIGFHRYAIEGVYRGDLFTHRIAYNSHLHISEMYYSMGAYIQQAEKISPETDQNVSKQEMELPVYQSSESRKKSVEKKLKAVGVKASDKLFLIGPGEGRIPLREWPLENMVTLIRKIVDRPDHRVVLVGVSDCLDKAGAITEQISDPNRCVNLVGQTSMEELLTLCGRSQALITNDSGLSHLAALTPISQYVMFGPETPKIFASLSKYSHIFYVQLACSPCLSVYNHRNSACRDNQCLKLISPQHVYDTIFL